MECKLCKGKDIKIIYNGKIRDGGLGRYTDFNVLIFQCMSCNLIWHEEQFKDISDYYESEEYRNSLEGGAEEERFYELHDKENLDKFEYTGTDVFRGKTVADIGCGAGAFLDFLVGVAKRIIAIEPSRSYRNILLRKGYQVYAYAEESIPENREAVDVLTSFDVIEHVSEPQKFLKSIYELLSQKGIAIIGTPTDAPVMRSLLGESYEKQILFSTQHLWIFSERNLRLLAEEQGFDKISFRYFQRYGIANMLGWIRDKSPGSEIDSEVISRSLDGVWRGQLSDNKMTDYIVMYLQK